MSLSSALDTAKSSLLAVQTQTSVVSRNIANINDPTASRKVAQFVTGPGGRVEVSSITKSSNTVLYRNMLEASSSMQSSKALASGFERLSELMGDTDKARSPAALVGKLADALQAYATTPNGFEFGRAVTDAARDLTASLNEGSETIATIRRDANASLALAAEDMTALLADIERQNDLVVRGTTAGQDVTDFADRRDAAVTQLSQYVGVSARMRGNNDLVLHTDSGVTLFDKTARPVEFSAGGMLEPGEPGPVFRIDGVAVTGASAYMPIRSGMVHGLTVLRDEVAVTYQRQLDEIARTLVSAFAETNAAAPADTRAGLFTSAAPADLAALASGQPPAVGLAARLTVSAAAIANPHLVRDGGINDSDADPANANPFRANTSGASGFNARINALSAALAARRDMGAAAGLGTSATLADFAASSVGWLQAGRAAALSDTEYRSTLLQRTQDTLSNETGINMESEMTLLTDLQRSYQASAKLIATIDEMLATLLGTI